MSGSLMTGLGHRSQPQRRVVSIMAKSWLVPCSLALALVIGASVNALFAFVAGGASVAFRPNQPLAQQSRLSVLPGLKAGTTLEKPPVNSEWRLGVGHAIDVLRKDVVGLFEDTDYTPDFSIYSSDIKLVDARLPSFQLDGIATYQQVLSTLRWSVRAACDDSQLEITGMTPPINNQLFMRWRLKLYFKDVLGGSKDGPFIFEGYSRYEFDPWSAEIVKHTIDITNPPMFVSDLVARYARGPTWLMPATTGLGVPMRSESFYRPLSSTGFQLQVSKEATVITATSSSSAANHMPSFTGATAPVARG
ncbi:unnamed protein product [Polarella glacialis]|nr:unnamed protein product [Polarella glacialis]CAE8615149.1 unnamed protein product [Polarella glacialis]